MKHKKRLNTKDVFPGQKLGKFTVIKSAPKVEGWKVNLWECMCECGEIRIYSTTQLNHSTSCGCTKKNRVGPRKPEEQTTNRKLKSAVFCAYTRGARRRNLEFLLTREFVEKISQQNCHYCNLPPSNRVSTKGALYFYSGIDRVDNNKGYLEDNVLPCCKHCNHLKGERTVDEFKEHVIQIFKHLKLKVD